MDNFYNRGETSTKPTTQFNFDNQTSQPRKHHAVGVGESKGGCS